MQLQCRERVSRAGVSARGSSWQMQPAGCVELVTGSPKERHCERAAFADFIEIGVSLGLLGSTGCVTNDRPIGTRTGFRLDRRMAMAESFRMGENSKHNTWKTLESILRVLHTWKMPYHHES
jgi:hypothetical protein